MNIADFKPGDPIDPKGEVLADVLLIQAKLEISAEIKRDPQADDQYLAGLEFALDVLKRLANDQHRA